MDGVGLGPDELWGGLGRCGFVRGWEPGQRQNQEQISKLIPDAAVASSPSKLFYTPLSVTTISHRPQGERLFSLKGIQAFSSKAK